MVKNHLKRIATPKTWNILRKAEVYITRPNPGAHNYRFGTSINTLMKEVIGNVETRKEVKHILHKDNVLVDGKRRHDERHNVGLMDVISFPRTKEHYRVVLSGKGKIAARPINGGETSQKLVRITGKKNITSGKTQLSTMDGRTMLVKNGDYKVGDSLLIELPSQEIKSHYALAVGNAALILDGKHAGDHGVIEAIEGRHITIKAKDHSFLTMKRYTFVIGDKKAAITCSP